jgi:hypothetical protein
VGCPIRRSRDHRALAPPPSFSQRATSFIASRCQGIHQMPFSCSPTPSPKAAHQKTDDREQRTDPAPPTRSARHRLVWLLLRLTVAWALRPMRKHRPYRGDRPRRTAYPCPGTTDQPHKGPKAKAAHPVMPASRSRLASRCQNVHKTRPARFGRRAPISSGRRNPADALARPAARTHASWWAWADLNGRPHAYQACALAS